MKGSLRVIYGEKYDHELKRYVCDHDVRISREYGTWSWADDQTIDCDYQGDPLMPVYSGIHGNSNGTLYDVLEEIEEQVAEWQS